MDGKVSHKGPIGYDYEFNKSSEIQEIFKKKKGSSVYTVDVEP